MNGANNILTRPTDKELKTIVRNLSNVRKNNQRKRERSEKPTAELNTKKPNTINPLSVLFAMNVD